MPRFKQLATDLACGISLVNLCFIGVWAELIVLNSPISYQVRATTLDLVAAPLNVAIIGSTLGAALYWSRLRAPPKLAALVRYAFALLLLIPLNVLRRAWLPIPPSRLMSLLRTQGAGIVLLSVLGSLAILFFLVRFRRSVVTATTTLVLFLSPFALVTTARAVWILANQKLAVAYADGPLASALPRTPPLGNRVLVLLFDELDQRLLFSERPAGLAFPEFDRLRNESLHLDQSSEAGTGTDTAVPSLIAGETVTSSTSGGPDELVLTFEHLPQPVGWHGQANLFSRARELGVNSGLVGWYHPYCRILNVALTSCHWEPHSPVVSRGQSDTFLGAVFGQVRGVLPWGNRIHHIENYRRVIAAAKSALADSTLSIVFIHLNVPHLPPIYSPDDSSFTIHNYRADGYFDNLVLADRALGELRGTMDSLRTSDVTTILLTSDHSWRSSAQFDGRHDVRVPFLVKLGSRTDGVAYDRPMSALVLHDLVLELAQGRLHTYREMANWLDHNAERFPFRTVLPQTRYR